MLTSLQRRRAIGFIAAAMLQACGADSGVIAPRSPQRSATSGALAPWGPWSKPLNLGPVVNSTVAENRPFIAFDGLSLYITTNRPGGMGVFDILVSQRNSVTSPWETPVNLGPGVNTAGNDLAPWVSSDEKLLYFARDGECGDVDLYVATRSNKHDAAGWKDATDLGCAINSAFKDADPFFVSDANSAAANNFSKGGTLYFLSNRPGGPGDFDIYSAVRDKKGAFLAPTLVTSLNSPFTEYKIVISQDGLEAFIGSNRPGGSGGLDIWTSTRSSMDAAWSAPANLGPVVNSAANDAPGSLSADGTTLYFESLRPGGYGLRDIYMVTRSRLE